MFRILAIVGTGALSLLGPTPEAAVEFEPARQVVEVEAPTDQVISVEVSSVVLERQPDAAVQGSLYNE